MPRAREHTDVTYVGFLMGHGGDALQMLALARGIRDLGAKVKLVVPAIAESESFQRRCDELGLPCERTPLLTSGLEGPPQRLPSVVSLLRSLDATVTHFHSGNTYLPRSAMAAMAALRYPKSFVTLQSPYETLVPGSARARFWAATASRQFHAVVSPSDHARRFQIRCGVKESVAVTVRNSIDTEAMARGDGRVAREDLGVGPDLPLVLFSSRMDGQKRPVDAVRAFAAVADEHPDALLIMLGGHGDAEGDVRHEVAARGLEDRVRLVGYRTNIPDWLAAATVWILPTERENFSVAVLEAMAAGCAVLSTNCPGNDEVLVDEENALVFDIGDVTKAGDQLRRLLSDDDLRARLGASATETAQRYSVEPMVEAYRQLYVRYVDLPALR